MTQEDTSHFCNTIESKSARSRNWFFTLNNYTAEDVRKLERVKADYVFQEEKGKQGTPHLQGTLMYKNAVSFSTIKKLLPRAHIERVKNKLASIRYCAKTETRVGDVYTNLDNLEQLLHSNTQKMVKKKMSPDEMRQEAMSKMDQRLEEIMETDAWKEFKIPGGYNGFLE